MSLSCQRVGVQIGSKVLLDEASAELRAGRVTAILGPNGAGKSTLLAVLSGQRRPTQGKVELDKRPLHGYQAAELALRRCVMPQESALAFDFTAREVVTLGRFPHRRTPAHDEDVLVAAAMALTDVTALGDRILNTLSGGEKARVHLARALAQLWHPRPDDANRWMLLDEPTAALDLAHQHAAMRLLRNRAAEGLGVVVVLHDVNLALRYADDVVVVSPSHGVQQGRTHQLLVPELIEAVWGTPCEPITSKDGTLQYLF